MSVVHRPLCPDGTAAATLACESPCAKADRPWVLTATILASAMAFIDGTLVHIALPAIQGSLHASFADLQWVVNAYTLMLGSLLLAGGALGDQIGRRRVFCAGLSVFTLASVACALAPTAPFLIAGRAIQGVGAALMVPQSLAIIAATFPQAVRGRAIGTWAAFSALTTTAGPVVGGLLIDTVSWRAAFWINLPLAAAALYLAARHIPENRSATQHAIDWPGACLATLSLGSLTYVLTRWPSATGGLPGDLAAAIALTLAGAIGFVWVERHTASPLVPLALFRTRAFGGLNVITLLLYAALGGVLFLLPYNLIQVQGYSATAAGLALLPLGLLIGGLSRYSGHLADRWGPRPALIGGPLLVAGGCASLAVPGIGGAYASTFMLPVVMLALGMAIVVSPLTTAVMNAVPNHRSGLASGVNNSASRVAGMLAVALSGALVSAVFSTGLENRLTSLPLSDESRATLLADSALLAELEVPKAVVGETRAAAKQSVDGAFVGAFRAGVLLNAMLAAMAAAMSLWLLRPAGPHPAKDHPG